MNLSPKQVEAIEVIKNHRYSLLVGGARSGKTFLSLRRNIYWSHRYPGSRRLITRRYGVDARRSIFQQSLPAVLAGLDLVIDRDYSMNATEMRLMFPGDSEIIVAGLDDENRVDKLLGTEYSSIYFNEVHDTPYMAFRKLRSRLSQNVGSPHKAIADLNPTTTAHWTYKLFYQGIDPEIKEPLRDFENYGKIEMSPYDNPFLPPDYISSELETMHGSLRNRFLLGKYASTSDLAVFQPKSTFEEKDFITWAQEHGWGKVRFVGGLDLGFEDADGIAILAYIEGTPDVWLVYEHKMRRQGIGELAEACHAAIRYIEKFPTPNKDIYIYADPAWKRDLYDLEHMYNLPVRPAYKRDKKIAIDLLQDEVNDGLLHIMDKGAFFDECEQIVWTRDDSGIILREIDDSAYHPDLMDAILYAYRFLWVYGGMKRKE